MSETEELQQLVKDAIVIAEQVSDAGQRVELRARGISAGDYAASELGKWLKRAVPALLRSRDEPLDGREDV